MTLLTTAPIRRLSRADLPRCLDLAADRGLPGDDRVCARVWRLLLSAGEGFGVDDPDGDGLIGSFVLTRYGPGLACLSTVLVAERHARRGLGRRLVARALEEAGRTPVFLFADEGDRELYERSGFRTVGRATAYTGHFRPEPEPESDLDVEHGAAGSRATTRRATAADLPAVLALDTAVSSADRTHLITRIPAFADQLRVAEGPGGPTGFAAAWRTGGTTVIGPVVAQDDRSARQLIADLAVRTEGELRLDPDDRHHALGSWLTARGLAPRISTAVMIHGAADLPGDHHRRFAPMGVTLG
ncbi:GNAT family N-acetyltransferase [Streptomyces sp. NPDC047108]|uniref:GNAT family N-acetyltransferase n=1 Tax=Streptomyces sp. NPDC047108 TaxID=3155025 RepID=UPI0033D6BDBD